MAGFGFGFGSRTAPRRLAPFLPPLIAQLSPSESWIGTAASGFTSTPSDPARTTAKPVVRMITPERQAFTDTLLVGVVAGANNGGSLYDNLGLEKVRLHCEGNVVEITAPTFQTPPAPDASVGGSAVTPKPVLGWWCELKNDGRFGAVDVYVEAIPKDVTMQSRIMGPYRFFPAAQEHQKEITINPDAPTVAGQNYQIIDHNLWNWIWNNRATLTNVGVTIVKGGDYDIGGGSYTFALDGYITVEASEPVTFTRPDRRTTFLAGLRTKTGRIRFRGANLTFDQKNQSGYYTEDNFRNWYEGVTFTDSNGPLNLWQGRVKGPPSRYGANQGAYWTHCRIENCGDVLREQFMALNCRMDSCFTDVYSGTPIVIDNALENDRNSIYDAFHNAIRVHYTGAAAAATIEMNGQTGANNRVITLKEDGASVGTFMVKADESGFIANTNYTQQNVVDWINGLAGWTALLLPNDFVTAGGEINRMQAARLSMPLAEGVTKGSAWGPLDAKSAPLDLQTVVDTHADIYARNGMFQNVWFSGNSAWMYAGQGLLLSDPNNHYDFMIVNNLFHAYQPGGNYAGQSQFGHICSHVVFAHNSWAAQAITIRRGGSSNFDGDAYTLFANNVAPALGMGTPEDSDVTYTGQHTSGIDATQPFIAVDSTTGGEQDSWYADAAAGDFTPQGELLAHLKVPVLKWDRNGKSRGAAAPAGALR